MNKNNLTPSGQKPCKSHFVKNPFTPFNSCHFRFQKESRLPRKWYQLRGTKIYIWNCWDCWYVFITKKLKK
jgi:hypothetical protein